MTVRWYAYYQQSDSTLVAVGTEDDAALQSTPAGIARVVGEEPRAGRRWNGSTHAFEDEPAPTDDEQLVFQARKVRLTPTSAAGKAALRDFMDEVLCDAQAMDWFNSKIQADGSVAPAAKTTIGALNTAAYNRAKNAAVSWFQAP